MTEPSRVRNLAVLFALAIIYVIIRLVVQTMQGLGLIEILSVPQTMLDILSVPMLLFGLYALYLIIGEAWDDFWAGEQTRRALGLFALSALLISVVAMRPYGIITRNVEGADDVLSKTDIYPIALYVQALGLWLFTRASETPTVGAKRPGWGRIIAAFVIGVLVASSRALEPSLMFVSKLFARIF